ncbi:MAG: sel1 repeat family protein [Prevotella sp.]|nr:sel1 repeat family protein [Prevotella sp.]
MRNLLLILMLICSTAVGAQSAERLYNEGKSYYDREKYSEAVPKLKAAAEKGHKKAQYRLARCYDKGYGVKEDDQAAFRWYLKAAQQGHAKAQYQLGKCYKNGEGVEKDRVKAFLYFTKSAKQDNANAQLALGKCYLKGKGVASDRAKATMWLKKAVKNEKGGKEILQELREEAALGDEDAKLILSLVK